MTSGPVFALSLLLGSTADTVHASTPPLRGSVVPAPLLALNALVMRSCWVTGRRVLGVRLHAVKSTKKLDSSRLQLRLVQQRIQLMHQFSGALRHPQGSEHRLLSSVFSLLASPKNYKKCISSGRRLREYSPHLSGIPGSTVASISCVSLRRWIRSTHLEIWTVFLFGCIREFLFGVCCLKCTLLRSKVVLFMRQSRWLPGSRFLVSSSPEVYSYSCRTRCSGPHFANCTRDVLHGVSEQQC